MKIKYKKSHLSHLYLISTVLPDPLCVKCPEQSSLERHKVDCCSLKLKIIDPEGLPVDTSLFWGDRSVPKLDCDDSETALHIY